MRTPNNHKRNLIGLLTGILLLQGCYTQIGYERKVQVDPARTYYQSEIQTGNQTSQAVADSVVTMVSEETPTIIYENHYWMNPPDMYYFGYHPRYNRYNSYRYYANSWYDPWYSDWYYTSPYSVNIYYGYNSWCWSDPYWYPRYYYGHHQSWAYHYWTPSYHGYGGHGSTPVEDPLEEKKRDWDRRGTLLTDREIVRPGVSTVSVSNDPGTASNPDRIIRRPEQSMTDKKELDEGGTKPVEVKPVRIIRRDDPESSATVIRQPIQRTPDKPASSEDAIGKTEHHEVQRKSTTVKSSENKIKTVSHEKSIEEKVQRIQPSPSIFSDPNPKPVKQSRSKSDNRSVIESLIKIAGSVATSSSKKTVRSKGYTPRKHTSSKTSRSSVSKKVSKTVSKAVSKRSSASGSKKSSSRSTSKKKEKRTIRRRK